MGNNDAALKRYYHDVKRALPCSSKIRKQIVQQLQESVRDFILQNPDADFAAVQHHFGTPQEIASGYIDEQGTPELLKKMTIKKRVLAIVAGVMAIILVSWMIAVAWSIHDDRETNHGYIGVTVEKD